MFAETITAVYEKSGRNKFLLGNQLTIADFYAFSILASYFLNKKMVGAEMFQTLGLAMQMEYPSVGRYIMMMDKEMR